jgi:hypothetical protein
MSLGQAVVETFGVAFDDGGPVGAAAALAGLCYLARMAQSPAALRKVSEALMCASTMPATCQSGLGSEPFRRAHEEAMRLLQALRLILSGQSGVEDAHVVAAHNLTRLLGREPGAQHRCYEVDPLRIVLQTSGRDLLIRADTHVIDANNLDHLFHPLDVFVQAGEEQMPTEPPVSATIRAWSGVI